MIQKAEDKTQLEIINLSYLPHIITAISQNRGGEKMLEIATLPINAC